MTSPARFFIGLPRENQSDLPHIPTNPVPNEGGETGDTQALQTQARDLEGQVIAQAGINNLQRLCSAGSETPCLESIANNLSQGNAQNLGIYWDSIRALTAEAQGIRMAAQQQGQPMAGLPPEFAALTVQIIHEVMEILPSPDVIGEVTWGPGQDALGIRTVTLTILFELFQFGGVILHQSGAGELSPPHRNLMTRLAERVREFISVNQAQSARTRTAGPRPLPNYMASYVDAQLAALNNDREEAITRLATTRRQIQEADIENPLDPEHRGGLRDQIRTGVDATLWQLADDTQAVRSLNARTRTHLTALGYLALGQMQGEGEELSEDEQIEQVQKIQQFQILAAILLNDGLAGQGSLQVLEGIRDLGRIDENSRAMLRQMILQRSMQQGQVQPSEQEIEAGLDEMEGRFLEETISGLQERYGSNETFRESLQQMGFEGEMTNEDWQSLFDNARDVANLIIEHQEESPFNAVLEQDEENQGLVQAGHLLDENPELRARIIQALGLPATGETPLDGHALAFVLTQYGDEADNFLAASIPEEERPEGYQAFAEAITRVSQGLEGDGLEFNYTQPVQGLMETMAALAQENPEAYLPAYQLFLNELSQTETIASDVAMPETIRNAASQGLEENEGFSIERVLHNTVLNPEFYAMTVFGTVVAGMSELGLLRRAGTGGRLGRLVEGGRITGWGHWLIGTGVAATMNVVGMGIHALQHDDVEFSWSQAVTGTLFAGAAIGLTMGTAPFMARRFGIVPGARPTGWQRFAMGTTSLGFGSGFMWVGATANRAIYTGEWDFNLEEGAETAITLGAFYGAHQVAWRRFGARFFPRAMVGPHALRGIETFAVEPMIQRNPMLAQQQRPELTRFLAREMALHRFPYDQLRLALENEQVPLFDPQSDQPISRIREATFVEQQGEALFQSPEFTSQWRMARREARLLLAENPRARQVWFEISRDTEGNLEFEILTETPRETSHHFAIDRQGNLQHLGQISDPVVQDALMRVVQERIGAVRTITTGDEPGSTQVFQRAREIANDPQHVFYQRLREAFTEVRRHIQDRMDDGVENPEVFIRFRRNLDNEGEDLSWQITDRAPQRSDGEGILRVTKNGYSNEAVSHAIPGRSGDGLLRVLLNTLSEQFFPVPITARMSGSPEATAGPTDTTAAIRPARRSARGRSTSPSPQSSPPSPPSPRRAPRPPQAEPPALPPVTDFAALAEQIRSRFPEITQEQVQAAAELIQNRSFRRGMVEAQMDVSSTSGSYATHPTVNVYRTAAGEYHFMLEGAEAPAGEHWGSYRIARRQVIEVQSSNPVFELALTEGLEAGALALRAVAAEFAPPAPPSPPPPPPPPPASPPPPPPSPPSRPSSSSDADPIGGTTQRRAVSAELRERSRRRGRNDEPTTIISTEEQAGLVEESRSEPLPEESTATEPRRPGRTPEEPSEAEELIEEIVAEEEVMDVAPEELIELDSRVDSLPESGPLPQEVIPTRRPQPSPESVAQGRLPRPTPVPSDVEGTPPRRTPTPPPLPPREASRPIAEPAGEPDAEPIPLTRRVRDQLEGIFSQETLRLEGVTDEIEIHRLASELDDMPIPQATEQRGQTRFDPIVVYHSPQERPVFRMSTDNPDLGFFILNRHLVWNGERGAYEVRGVRFSRGVGISQELQSLLQRLFPRD